MEIAIDDDQELSLRARGKFASFGQSKSTAVRLRQAKTTILNHEESLDGGRVPCFVIPTHMPGLQQVIRYFSVQGGDAKINSLLGSGTDGVVWATSRGTAVKVFHRVEGYCNERDAYLRLAEYGVRNRLAGFWLPVMRGYHDECRVVEMDLMQQPPYIIDFAKVRIDRPPDFADEVVADNEARGSDLFGAEWPRVKHLLESRESFQIYYLDPTPYNIVCR